MSYDNRHHRCHACDQLVAKYGINYLESAHDRYYAYQGSPMLEWTCHRVKKNTLLKITAVSRNSRRFDGIKPNDIEFYKWHGADINYQESKAMNIYGIADDQYTAKTFSGLTPLFCCVYRNDKGLVRKLLRLGASIKPIQGNISPVMVCTDLSILRMFLNLRNDKYVDIKSSRNYNVINELCDIPLIDEQHIYSWNPNKLDIIKELVILNGHSVQVNYIMDIDKKRFYECKGLKAFIGNQQRKQIRKVFQELSNIQSLFSLKSVVDQLVDFLCLASF